MAFATAKRSLRRISCSVFGLAEVLVDRGGYPTRHSAPKQLVPPGRSQELMEVGEGVA